MFSNLNYYLHSHSTVAPTSISLNTPESIIEGEEFSFTCISTGADPVSLYEYSKYVEVFNKLKLN